METPTRLGLRSVRELLLRAAAEGASGWVVVRERRGAVHRVGMRHGRIAQVRVAGEPELLLDALRRRGALDAERWHRAIEALGRSERRSGQLAVDVAGLHPAELRRALDEQVRGRLRRVLERSLHAGRDAWLERGELSASAAASALPVLEALPLVVVDAPPPRRPRPTPAIVGPRRPRTRKELRRLARELHPDRHPHLDERAREALGARLAALTAAFHGLD